ncbi:hypothetical protein CYMTET_6599 [Cymbomonas tetramitiformis]|uniref:Uncharacterized protein n=1 Tax=Cymbomonas tetramitiformis TaxID=36881 RepID=A0AAE0GWW2_9CHLO|nr:hypothetical protein CYMTET_6599 [Cymbomonas tetramitiformis]
MAKTANKPRMTCAGSSKSNQKTSTSEQHRRPQGDATADFPVIENMQAYDLSFDGSDSDSESNHSEKITPLGLSETISSEQEEFATPEVDRATGMEGIQREEDATSNRTDKTHPQDSPPKRQKDKKVGALVDPGS